MNGKWIIAVILIVALVGICAASIFAVWQGARMVQSSGISFDIGSVNTAEAKTTEEKTLSVSGPVSLKVENDFGFVKVEPGAAGEVLVKAEKTAWGSSDADAQKALKDIQVVIEQDGDKIRISIKRPVEVDVVHIGPSGGQVNFTITVPAETSVDLSSSNGDLTLSGTQGAAVLNTSFGDVDVTDLTGSLTADTSNGGITARNITADEASVDLQSDFGDIDAETVSAGDVTVKSTNGTLTLSKVEASGKLDVGSDFGSLEIKSGEARSLEAHTSNGKVSVKNVKVNEAANVSSDFGDLTLEDVSASGLDLQTQNGAVKVSGARGKVTAHSDYGDVDVSAEQAIINLTSNNGKITFSGSLADGEHTLQSDFGNIEITLPEGTALTFDLKTDFGKIKSDFPVTISGDLEEKHWVGTINGGGAQLNVSTNNGNITLQISK